VKVLITVQEPGKPRHRSIAYAKTTFDAVLKLLGANLDPNTYISAKAASDQDERHYPELRGASD